MKKKYEWLEVMRGLAALWVLLHHADLSVNHFFPSQLNRPSFLANGYLGVDFFFLLSGFIIAYSSNRLVQAGKDITDYARLRVIRIYVPYLPVGIALYVAYILLPSMSEGDRTPGLLTSLFLMPTTSPPALSVAWTLVHEVIFYAIFSIFFISKRVLWWLMAVWAGAIAYTHFGYGPVSKPLSYLLSPLNLNFLIGVALYYGLRRGIGNRLAIASLASGLLLVLWSSMGSLPVRWLATLGFALLIVAAISEWAVKTKPWSFFMMLGAASYSLYLVHNPALSILSRAMGLVSSTINSGLAYLIVAVCALACGLAYYFFYEKRALRVVNALWKKTIPVQISAVSATANVPLPSAPGSLIDKDSR
jgi:exopolysaccharide production protein ExoZ